VTRSRTLLAALVTALPLALGAPASAVPRGDEAVVATVPARERDLTGLVAVPRSAWVVLRGHGWGHGHGMSQYGAGGAAAAGRTWEQILDFYYPGTRRGSASGEIRVLLTGDTTPDLVVRHQPGLLLLDAGTAVALPDGVTDQWRLVTSSAQGPVLQRRTVEDGVVRWRPERRVAPGAGFSAGGAPVVLVTPAGEAAYRGRLSAVPGVGTVDTLPLEDYVRGVVTREMPASWPAEAIAAQAVAARTYAVRSRSAARAYDVCDTTACQVYGGVAGETAAGDAAVGATSGTVLTYDGAPALTMYSSSNGGRALSAGLPYLVDRRDPWDDWAPNPNHTWMRRVADTALEALRPAVGDLTGVEVTGREGGGEWGGRVTGLRLVGTTGSAVVPGDELKAALGLKERWFALVGARRRW
jgi:SpoIID/LytB domain protein